ncbi:hypothetical protein [Spongiactinospora sp. TRM90649]|uniref:hypothetical protein n=1 Tax=Spongiactinospora sp. TRM90649 TaxID=3031114 RepID=UPI0023F93849|nr:hypothetical protein [Spongiactinospora sp. TRM90649]MDF5757170.1 hypothetical protein [Spongiactinospora sp. TRM90649]
MATTVAEPRVTETPQAQDTERRSTLRSLADSAARGGFRGAIGAMAMSGLRQTTTSLGLIERTPPEAFLERAAPGLLHGVPRERRPAIVELVHWTYGAVGGAAFGLLPGRIRRHPWTGPVWGILFWGAFQTAIAPVLGLPRRSRGRPVEDLALLADHLLYGVVVAASPWPHRR